MKIINNRNLIILVGFLLIMGLAVVFGHKKEDSSTVVYQINQGTIFGTFYNIRYQYSENLETQIKKRMEEFDGSLSTFNPHSVISVLNQGKDTVWDEYFTTMYATAMEINRASHGAFDITVAPLVNAWGFGFKNKEKITPELIDSLRQVKNILDASAIAKGQGCDVVASLLEEYGIQNYLVDIGGEVVARGHNDRNENWRVGITKPEDDITGQKNEIQAVISTDSICMATSGNYRQFYYENGLKRSHTIDPRTGYPVRHNLLSATVVASSCMRADALATACMVLGQDSAILMIDSIPDASCYLIVANDSGMEIVRSKRWKY